PAHQEKREIPRKDKGTYASGLMNYSCLMMRNCDRIAILSMHSQVRVVTHCLTEILYVPLRLRQRLAHVERFDLSDDGLSSVHQISQPMQVNCALIGRQL